MELCHAPTHTADAVGYSSTPNLLLLPTGTYHHHTPTQSLPEALTESLPHSSTQQLLQSQPHSLFHQLPVSLGAPSWGDSQSSHMASGNGSLSESIRRLSTLTLSHAQNTATSHTAPSPAPFSQLHAAAGGLPLLTSASQGFRCQALQSHPPTLTPPQQILHNSASTLTPPQQSLACSPPTLTPSHQPLASSLSPVTPSQHPFPGSFSSPGAPYRPPGPPHSQSTAATSCLTQNTHTNTSTDTNTPMYSPETASCLTRKAHSFRAQGGDSAGLLLATFPGTHPSKTRSALVRPGRGGNEWEHTSGVPQPSQLPPPPPGPVAVLYIEGFCRAEGRGERGVSMDCEEQQEGWETGLSLPRAPPPQPLSVHCSEGVCGKQGACMDCEEQQEGLETRLSLPSSGDADLTFLHLLLDLAAKKREAAAQHCEQFTSMMEAALTPSSSPAFSPSPSAAPLSLAFPRDAAPVGSPQGTLLAGPHGSRIERDYYSGTVASPMGSLLGMPLGTPLDSPLGVPQSSRTEKDYYSLPTRRRRRAGRRASYDSAATSHAWSESHTVWGAASFSRGPTPEGVWGGTCQGPSPGGAWGATSRAPAPGGVGIPYGGGGEAERWGSEGFALAYQGGPRHRRRSHSGRRVSCDRAACDLSLHASPSPLAPPGAY